MHICVISHPKTINQTLLAYLFVKGINRWHFNADFQANSGEEEERPHKLVLGRPEKPPP